MVHSLYDIRLVHKLSVRSLDSQHCCISFLKKMKFKIYFVYIGNNAKNRNFVNHLRFVIIHAFLHCNLRHDYKKRSQYSIMIEWYKRFKIRFSSKYTFKLDLNFYMDFLNTLDWRYRN